MKKTMILTAALLALALSCSVQAQVVKPPGEEKGKEELPKENDPGRGGDLAGAREKVRDAKAKAKAGDVAGVEAAVATLNLAEKNTAEWHMETAQGLMQTAEEMAREGDGAKVTALVNRALQQLQQAEQKAKDAAAKAAAKTLAGFIQERYLADNEAAVANYEAAAQLAPSEAKSAKESAERLKRTDENARGRTEKLTDSRG